MVIKISLLLLIKLNGECTFRSVANEFGNTLHLQLIVLLNHRPHLLPHKGKEIMCILYSLTSKTRRELRREQISMLNFFSKIN